MQRSRTAILQEQERAQQGGDEPEEHVDEIDPDGVLHSFGGAVGGVGVDVDEEFAEDAEDGGPEDAGW